MSHQMTRDGSQATEDVMALGYLDSTGLATTKVVGGITTVSYCQNVISSSVSFLQSQSCDDDLHRLASFLS
jgi:hypothetical protein